MSGDKPRITAKHLKNKRFWQTEQKILQVYFEHHGYITVSELTKKAEITRSTFYHHHRAVYEILTDYEDFLVTEYGREINSLSKLKHISIRKICSTTVFFISRHKKFFEILRNGKRREIFFAMQEKARPLLIKEMRLPPGSAKVYLVCAGEINTLITDWIDFGCCSDSTGRLISDTTLLIETARIRLAPILA